ncbi:MAG: tetratricopeptide repeat protein [Clostridiales bacterium]|nr:tetratricopeptide repeat protein [Clostridiales bacterium]
MKKLAYIGMFFVMIFILSGCTSAGGYYRNGKKSLASRNYEDAAKSFSLAIEENPNRSDYYIGYAMAFIGLERYDKAIEQFDSVIMDKKIVMVQENNKRALRGKGIAYFNMQDYNNAIDQLDQALELDVLSDLDMDILYYKGKSLMTVGAYEEAADIYTQIIERFGEDTQVLGDRAYAYQMTGDFDKSVEDYDKAIAIKPSQYEYYFGKYYLLQEMGKTTEAQAVLDEAAKLEVKTKEDKYNLARIHFYQGLHDQAFPELSESFANGFADSYFYIGEIYSIKKDYSTAKYYYEKYIEEGGEVTPAAYNQVASCYMKIGEYEEAIPYLELGIRYAHGSMLRILLKNEIVAYENMGDFETALAKLKNYKTAYPNDTDALREEVFLMSRQ